MCGQWGKKGYLRKEKFSNLKKIINFEKFKEIIDEIIPFAPYIYIWGGEPFLHPEIIKIIEYLNSKKLSFAINTNGTYLNKYAEKLVNANYKYDLIVSVDGPSDVHDKIRGVKGTFKRVSQGIKRIQKIKKLINITEPKIIINSVIGKNSYKTLIKMIKIAKDFNANELTISLPWFISEEKGKKYSQIMKNNFNCEAKSWRGFVNEYRDINTEKLKKDIKLILQNKEIKAYLNIPLKIGDLNQYFNNLEFCLNKNRCYAPWYGADIRPDGGVTFCSDYPDYIIGNIYKEPLLKIWNGKKAQKFRKYLRKNKKLPICNRCCRLYISP
jgi:radical SAM protein with 4Fe4S-binding SPASM domain